MRRLALVGLVWVILLMPAGCVLQSTPAPIRPAATDMPGATEATATQAPTLVARPSPAASATALPDPAEITYTQVEIVDLGLLVEVPEGWARLDPGWAWSKAGGDAPLIELVGRPVPPPQEVEAALLPSPSAILASSPIELSWGAGRRVTLELYGSAPVDGGRAPVLSVETHVLVVISRQGTRYAYDFISRAHTQEELADLLPVLQHMLESSALLQG